MVFLASGLTIRYGIHFRVDLLLARLPKHAAIGLGLFAVAGVTVGSWMEMDEGPGDDY